MTAAVSARSTWAPTARTVRPPRRPRPAPPGPSRPRVRRARTGGRGSAARPSRSASATPSRGQQLGEVGDVGRPRAARAGGTAWRGRARDRAQPLDGLGGPGVVPPHDRPGGPERDDPVDAELGELLHDQLGPVALHQRERHGDRRARRAAPTRSGRSGSSGSPKRAGRQRPAPVAEHERVAGAQPQHPLRGGGASSGVEHRRVEVVDERERARGGRRGAPATRSPQRKAERIRDRKPGVGGRDRVAAVLGELPEQLLLLRR